MLVSFSPQHAATDRNMPRNTLHDGESQWDSVNRTLDKFAYSSTEFAFKLSLN